MKRKFQSSAGRATDAKMIEAVDAKLATKQAKNQNIQS